MKEKSEYEPFIEKMTESEKREFETLIEKMEESEKLIEEGNGLRKLGKHEEAIQLFKKAMKVCVNEDALVGYYKAKRNDSS